MLRKAAMPADANIRTIADNGRPTADDRRATRRAWPSIVVLGLVAACVGLPVNTLPAYFLLLLAAVIAFTGDVSRSRFAWFCAVFAVVLALFGQWLVAPPKIEEGHNIFLPHPTLQRGLPPDAARFMTEKFAKRYPCNAGTLTCPPPGSPERVFAFSADGVFDKPKMSRRVTTINFTDPVWQGFGFFNEQTYNWHSDQHLRVTRDGRFWKGLHRWRVMMPWFVAYEFPKEHVGSALCWRGDVLWERDGGRFETISHANEACRTIEAADIGRRIFGAAIEPDSLTMRLDARWSVRIQRALHAVLTALGALAVLVALVRWHPRRMVLPLLLLGAALAAIAAEDGSIIGGVRPFDGGDDGLFYDGLGRTILQHIINGNFAAATEGGEKVFYYGGPGLRYFRALEHILFGETYLGYLSLLLVLPLAVLALFRRFVSERVALGFALAFILVPFGAIFGTSFFHYAKWAIRGFADPAAYIFALCGFAVLLKPQRDFATALGGALLLALGVFMKPIVLPACAIFAGGAGLSALWQRQWPRAAGVALGFATVGLITLHNWVFGGVFVPLSANAADSNLLTTPPSIYLSALSSGESLRRVGAQLIGWLSMPSELRATVPLNAAAVAVVIYVTASRRFDPWLRLVGVAALVQHTVAWLYAPTPRYHFLTWFLTLLVVVVWVEAVAGPVLARRFPSAWRKLTQSRLASALGSLQRMSA